MTVLRAILLDLDDTLFDHAHASQVALKALHAEHAAHVDYDTFSTEHAELLEHFHQKFLQCEYSLDEARAARMTALFNHFNLPVDNETALRVAMTYRDLHQANRRLVAGAADLLEKLYCEYSLAIVTNNSSAEQHAKLKHLGIAGYFKALAISEEVGATKPDARIYYAALDQLGCEPHEAVMLGDNLHADVRGAHDAGIAAVWFNRFLKSSSEPVEQVTSLAPAGDVLAAIRRAHQQRIQLFQGVKHVLSALAS
ncbi:MAG: HAD-IA family hydrolase [Burkholderiales bacterium]|nr:HAD-IA family hydrolase [Burkholderiales bacterium]